MKYLNFSIDIVKHEFDGSNLKLLEIVCMYPQGKPGKLKKVLKPDVDKVWF